MKNCPAALSRHFPHIIKGQCSPRSCPLVRYSDLEFSKRGHVLRYTAMLSKIEFQQSQVEQFPAAIVPPQFPPPLLPRRHCLQPPAAPFCPRRCPRRWAMFLVSIAPRFFATAVLSAP
jgi:hypothetical protein